MNKMFGDLRNENERLNEESKVIRSENEELNDLLVNQKDIVQQ
jgi:hypothetical protein